MISIKNILTPLCSVNRYMIIRLKYFINYNITHERRKANKFMLYLRLIIYTQYLFCISRIWIIGSYLQLTNIMT